MVMLLVVRFYIFFGIHAAVSFIDARGVPVLCNMQRQLPESRFQIQFCRGQQWKQQLIDRTSSLLPRIRGGAYADEYLDDGMDGNSKMFGDLLLAKSGLVASEFKNLWKSTPLVTRVYLAASFAITLTSFLFTSNVFPQLLLFDWSAVIMRLQLWRPLTAFLYFGQFGISYILTLQFLWQYMSQVEKLHYDKPEKFVLLLAFGCLSLLLSYSLLGISHQYLGHNLSTYLVYIWSKMFEGVSVNMMGLITLPAEMLPWFFCAQTMLVDGMFPMADLLGILIGHVYLYCEKQHMLEPPNVLSELFSSKRIRNEYRRYKADFE